MPVARRGLWAICGLPVAGVLILAFAVLRGNFAVSDEPPAGKESNVAKDPKPDDPPAAVPENPFPERPMAPEIDGGNGWLNTSGEISLKKDLRGKIVILDFWTYCCINCMHVLPDLKYLEEKYPKQLVVIGVHSAKFDNEKITDNIRRAIVRYEIVHPVINDSEMAVWNKFGVNSWPTLVVIDPEGRYLGFVPGEGNRELLDAIIAKLIPYHRAKGTLDETPVKFALESEKAAPTPLRFPGKIVADEQNDRLFISDSNHNRIVVASLKGALREVIGTGRAGESDGAYDKAEFDHPQGMALVGETLYVADTENHLLRAIDLKEKTVTTIAGTGEQSHDRQGGGPAKETGLNSPWDLCHVDGKLFIAMAGPHQIWVYDPVKQTVGNYAGNGRENIRNGGLTTSSFAQPSGLATDGKFLYAADSEGSAIRKIPLDEDGDVTTIAGSHDLPGGRCLFEFGDRDGMGDEARLQHPLGVLWHKGLVYVTDTYNHKLKTVDPETKEVKTLLGDGKAGSQDEPPRFAEPSGLALAGNTLYVADTNNHLIRTVDLATLKVSTLPIEGLAPPVLKPRVSDDKVKPIAVAPQKVSAGEHLAFEITVTPPENHKLNKLAAPIFRVDAPGSQTLLPADALGQRQEAELVEGNSVKVQVPLAMKTGETEVTLTLIYNTCRDGVGGLCKLHTVAWTIPLTVAPDATDTSVKLSTPKP